MANVKKDPRTPQEPASIRPRTYSVRAAAKELSISHAQVYVLMSLGKLRGKKAGNRTIILGEELDRYLSSLPDAVINAQKPEHRQAVEEARAAYPATVTGPAFVPQKPGPQASAPKTVGSGRGADKGTNQPRRHRSEAIAGA
jgi:hypothetical protein